MTKKKPAAMPAYVPSPEDLAWRAREDLRVLQQAADIKADRTRMSAAKTEAMKAVKAVTKPKARGK